MSFNEVNPNPYTSSGTDDTPETLPLDQIIRQAIGDAMRDLHVWLPVRVAALNGNQKVDLQILLQGRYADGTVVTLPVIPNCLVAAPFGAQYYEKIPIAVGDTGIALFCDRSLDAWSAGQGDITDPQDSRSHELSDAVFVPGLVPFAKQSADNSTDWVWANGKAQLRLAQELITLKNDHTTLMTALSQLITAIEGIQVTGVQSGGGTSTGLVSTTALESARQTLQSLLG